MVRFCCGFKCIICSRLRSLSLVPHSLWRQVSTRYSTLFIPITCGMYSTTFSSHQWEGKANRLWGECLSNRMGVSERFLDFCLLEALDIWKKCAARPGCTFF